MMKSKTKILFALCAGALVFYILNSVGSFLVGTAFFLSVVLAGVVFMITWLTREQQSNPFLLLLGLACLFVGFLDGFHWLFAYILKICNPPAMIPMALNFGSQFHMASRLLLALTLAGAAGFFKRKRVFPTGRIMAVFLGLTMGLFYWIINTHSFPQMVTADGVTMGHSIMGGMIVVLLVVARQAIRRSRDQFGDREYPWLVRAVVFAILSELMALSLALHPSLGTAFMAYFQLLSVYSIYRSIKVSGVKWSWRTDRPPLKAALNPEVLNAEIKALSSLVAIDLKTPAKRLWEMAEIVQHAADRLVKEEALPDILDQICTAARKMNNTIAQSISVQQVDTLNLVVNKETSSFHQLIQENAKKNQVLARLKNVTLNAQVKAGVPPINMDAARLHDVLDCLIGNALEVSESGSEITVLTTLTRGMVKTEVIDQGPGLERDTQEKLFKVGAKDRSGLALAIARKIVDAHAGTIGAKNNPGKGANVWFCLPLNLEG